ncbi:amino acid ABC transporter permease [Paraburkholderia acidicola]|uniref:Amino acid ABC transporter permease n=1 Tax=Paraburkholderia acidicola TaxID=1912599 RepID=A0ABV1LUK1_9BURK
MNLTSTLETLIRWSPLILKGFALNLLMSFLAVIFGTAAGAFLGIAQVTGRLRVRRAAGLFTELFRNAPTLVLLFFCMYLIPFEIKVGSAVIPLDGWVKAVFGLALSKMAYVSEIVRGGLNSIPSTQWEAAEALGFSRRDTLWRVIFPQCVKRMLPPWMNTYAVLIMSTPLAAVLGVQEALGMTRSAIASSGPDMLTPFYLFLLAIFFLYTYPISAWTTRLERRYDYQI